MPTSADKAFRPNPGGSPDELEQERRWLSASRKDPEKFHHFYVKYSRRIYNFVFRRTLDPDLSQELVARTFANALDHLEDFDWRGVRVGSWLFQIAANEIRRNHAAVTRRATVAGTKVQENTPDPNRGQLTHLIMTEDQRQLHDCLHQLPEQDQDIFILHYWEGLKTREIGAALGISENTVKTRLARGRLRLRTLMSEGDLADLAPTPDDNTWGNDPDLRFADWAEKPGDKS